ncbi:hypothetical protein [Hyphomicrobium sp.]|uniref:hypothetical protein n=1 Tax=Hyphomicrobium sp. TaxID=82 RepID=UPI000FA8615F|nr:hypothetical protein [Hyphomicrobium sp.]RUP08466.1 MAG: hypothetical protein EKK38_14680 [Hyphomicrobium sp.]
MNELAPLHLRAASADGSRIVINFSLYDFLFAYRLLVQEREQAMAREKESVSVLGGVALRNLRWVTPRIARLNSPAVKERLEVAKMHLASGSVACGVLGYELGQLIQLIEEDVHKESFFQYDHEGAYLLRSYREEWDQTFYSFTAEEEDSDYDLDFEIRSGVDCYALQQYTASVFHMMRVAEIGLRVLAKERGVTLPKDKPVEYANWQEVIREIDKSIKVIGSSWPASKKKDRALAFYNNAIISLNALKDIFRNQTMHLRGQFFESDASRAMNMTKEFMNNLGWSLTESHRGPIDWDQEMIDDPEGP